MNLEHYLYLFAKDTSLDSANSIEFLQVAMNFLCHKLQTSTFVHICRWLITQRKPTTTNLNHMFRHAFFVFCPVVATTEGHRHIEECFVTFRNVMYSSYFCRFYLQSKDYGTDVPFILFHFWWMLTCTWFN
jgi:hypothetical protein